MAVKQILLLGLKFIDPEKVMDNRYNIPRKEGDQNRPFWNRFQNEFEKLPLELRKILVDDLDPLDKNLMESKKGKIKSHFLKQIYPEGTPSPKKLDALISKHIYSHVVIAERKRKANEEKSRPIETPPQVPHARPVRNITLYHNPSHKRQRTGNRVLDSRLTTSEPKRLPKRKIQTTLTFSQEFLEPKAKKTKKILEIDLSKNKKSKMVNNSKKTSYSDKAKSSTNSKPRTKQAVDKADKPAKLKARSSSNASSITKAPQQQSLKGTTE